MSYWFFIQLNDGKFSVNFRQHTLRSPLVASCGGESERV
jgi:hypothetical protein